MQPQPNQALLILELVSQRIMDQLPQDMSPNLKLQYVGLYGHILLLHRAKLEITSKNLSHSTGVHIHHCARYCNHLQRMGILSLEVRRNSLNKGRVHVFYPITDAMQLFQTSIVTYDDGGIPTYDLR